MEPDYSYKGGFFLCPGDVNDDGYTDYIFSGGSNCLKLYYGGTKIDTTGFIIYEVQYTTEVFSDQVDPLGDVNGDGYNDFVISSPYNWSNGISYVYLFLGGDSISSEPSVTFMHSPWIDENSEGTFGHAVTGIGDIDKTVSHYQKMAYTSYKKNEAHSGSMYRLSCSAAEMEGSGKILQCAEPEQANPFVGDH